MAQPPPQSVPDFAGFPQSKTLFISAPVKVGVLLTPRGRSYRKTELPFASATAALAWCEAHGASLVYINAADPAAN